MPLPKQTFPARMFTFLVAVHASEIESENEIITLINKRESSAARLLSLYLQFG
jgi:hypothetical protein